MTVYVSFFVSLCTSEISSATLYLLRTAVFIPAELSIPLRRKILYAST